MPSPYLERERDRLEMIARLNVYVPDDLDEAMAEPREDAKRRSRYPSLAFYRWCAWAVFFVIAGYSWASL